VSTLTLVRHGQASPFLERTARLTELGRCQAEALARHWLAQGVSFTAVYTGGLERQIETERQVARCYHAAGRPWPEPVRDEAWSEYEAPAGIVPGEDPRAFQRAFEAAMLAWLQTPAWTAFHARVSGAIAGVQQSPSGSRVAVFTSGGPIGFAVHLAMQAPARSFLEVNWRVRNASFSEFLFDRDRLSLDSFNNIPHLDGPLRSYR